MEIFKDVKGYEGYYEISNLGRVRSTSYKGKRILKPAITKNGYLNVIFCVNQKKEHKFIHRLVAEAFIPNPNNLETVDHIDNCKEHNYVGNLQWLTREDNTSKAISKPIRCLQNNKIYPSQKAAAQELGLDQGSISKVVRGLMKKTKNYSFEYITEGENNNNERFN